jgi:hypothetical protein
MASGGFRATSGRPRRAGAKTARPSKSAKLKSVKLVAPTKPVGRPRRPVNNPVPPLKRLPLEHKLDVMNDADQPADRRDRMAVAAAPYVHPKAADQKLGKKEVAEKEARSAGLDPEWGDDLSPDVRPN